MISLIKIKFPWLKRAYFPSVGPKCSDMREIFTKKLSDIDFIRQSMLTQIDAPRVADLDNHAAAGIIIIDVIA